MLKAQGAEVIEIKGPEDAVMGKIAEFEGDALRTEFKAALNAYLASTPAAVKSRTLDDLIAFTTTEPREMPAMAPMMTPTTIATTMAARPTAMEMRPP